MAKKKTEKSKKVETVEKSVQNKTETQKKTKTQKKSEPQKFTASEWAKQKGLPTVVFSAFTGLITKEEFVRLARCHLNQKKYIIE